MRIGLADFRDPDTLEELTARADAGLYLARWNERDQGCPQLVTALRGAPTLGSPVEPANLRKRIPESPTR